MSMTLRTLQLPHELTLLPVLRGVAADPRALPPRLLFEGPAAAAA